MKTNTQKQPCKPLPNLTPQEIELVSGAASAKKPGITYGAPRASGRMNSFG